MRDNSSGNSSLAGRVMLTRRTMMGRRGFTASGTDGCCFVDPAANSGSIDGQGSEGAWGLFLLERTPRTLPVQWQDNHWSPIEFGKAVEVDIYILATTPFAAADILARTPDLAGQEELRYFKPLVQDGPHIQVSFRIGFTEPIKFPRARTQSWLRILSST